MATRIDWKKLIIFLLIPQVVGILSSLLSGNIEATYNTLQQPPLSPPGAVFGIVWVILYFLMGLASYIIADSYDSERKNALTFYWIQLFFNFCWSIVFFRFGMYFVAFVWLIVLIILVIITYMKFKRINATAGMLLIPYILWLLFAAYLNFGVWYLN